MLRSRWRFSGWVGLLLSGVVLGVDVAGEAVGAGFLLEGGGFVAGHGASQGDEIGGVTVGSEDLRVERWMTLGDGCDLLLRLILMVVGVGYDSPLVAGSVGG